MEKLDLTVAVTDSPVPGLTRVVPEWLVLGLDFRMGYAFDEATGVMTPVSEGSYVQAFLVGKHGAVRLVALYNNGQDSFDVIKALNKANLSTKSLQKRLLERLVTLGGEYAGVISGTPD